MKILVIGLGSIAKKHISVIRQIDKNPKIYALRSDKNAKKEDGIINLFSFNEIPKNLDFCIISNPTHKHYETIEKISELNIPIFLEKPAIMTLDNADMLINKINKKKGFIYVALNLRFHPVIQFLKNYLSEKRIIEANIYCGSYLPDWRPDSDYTKIYSADAKKGGGVHLDLIHEIDYSVFLFGKPENTISIKKKISDLKINSKDVAIYHFLYPDKIVNINLNYYRKKPKREIEIITNDQIITADLINSQIKDGENIIFSQTIDNLYTYKEQMKYFYRLIEKKEIPEINSFGKSLEILKICLK